MNADLARCYWGNDRDLRSRTSQEVAIPSKSILIALAKNGLSKILEKND